MGENRYMLELKNIVKDYPAGDTTVHALRGVSIPFRETEFVSILGPSGCGKTTLLNIIGGLDQYTSGDLQINGVSTKHYKDRDWDAYRNHSIGFVFQSYNLIPHQTVLQNVELALTLAGVSKSERRARAKKALEEVGLGNQLHKRSNQMSGGQMQRVAIARALVNDPDIILADEPTGALDTETSIQVMDLLKRISAHRLIVMVTHNPELAQSYSTRIIRMLDGQVVSDSAPVSEMERAEMQRHDAARAAEAKAKKKRAKAPSMSVFTAFQLSLKNLFTKKGRTTLTAFAGSIGIMGIALILAVSQGMTAYIQSVQEDALASYPLTIEKTTVDLTSLMETFMHGGDSGETHDNDAVYKKSAIYDMLTAINQLDSQENDLKSFKSYIERKLAENTDDKNAFRNALTGVQYSYGLDLQVYTKNTDGDIIQSDTKKLMQELMAGATGATMTDSGTTQGSGGLGALSSMHSSMESSMGMSGQLWQEMLTGNDGAQVNDILKKQYDVIYGDWPSAYNEIMLVVDENNELDDLTLYALGLESKETIDAIKAAAFDGKELTNESKHWSYEEICGQEFRVVLNSDCYRRDEQTGLYTDLRKTDAGLRYLYDNALTLRVSGIIRPSDKTQSAMLSGSIAYTKALTDYVIAQMKDSDVIRAQQQTPDVDVLTGLPFPTSGDSLTDGQKAEKLRDYINGLNDAGKAAAYVQICSIPTDEQLAAAKLQAQQQYTRDELIGLLRTGIAQSTGMDADTVSAYLSSMKDTELDALIDQAITEQVTQQYAEQVTQQLGAMSTAQLAAAMTQALPGYSDAQCAGYYDSVIQFSDSTYDDNLAAMGAVDLDAPTTINLYASSFENKESIERAIDDYNQGVEELSKIKYTDYVGIMMSSVTTIIHAITYVLLAFVAISLVVSSIMIGVITLISVQERTKEIGILRAIGASKRNVSSMFNAETVMIGCASGLIGVGVTVLLCLPINAILHALTNIPTLNAYLPLPAAIVLVLISIALSLIAGLIPSRSAARKDPVIALRTE